MKQLTEQAKHVLKLAEIEARQFNHAYVGTEHVLLGLLIEPSCTSIFQRLKINPDQVRGEIEKLVSRGPASQQLAELPLTPRAKLAIKLAGDAIGHVDLEHIEPEQLLIGLLLEPDGVACQVLRNLGLERRVVLDEALRYRLAQMRIVERAVRPVRASAARKRKMREELLAHLGAIYAEERDSLGDPEAALNASANRFGDPAELSHDLQRAVPPFEVRASRIEYWLGWRAPESVMRMMLRTSFISFGLIAALIVVAFASTLVFDCSHPIDSAGWRTLVAMAIFTPLAQFLIGICYYRTRDAIWGVFGSRKSLFNGICFAGLIMLIVLLCSFGTITLMNAGTSVVKEFALPIAAASFFAGIICLILARTRGRVEIRDTIWSCLDLEITS